MGGGESFPVLTEEDYTRIAPLIYEPSRIHLGEGKRELMASWLGKRLRATGCTTYAAQALLCGL